MTYQETVNHLYTLRNRGTKLGLGPMRALVAALGNPEKCYSAVHVGGTNGKGTVCAMTASVLRAAGTHWGLYTSPHLVSFTERIVADGRRIGEGEVVRLAGQILAIARNQNLQPTFFEVATAAALAHFASEGVAWTVAEVGLGGRLDATNVLTPAVSVITNVGLDHQAYLGETIAEIAGEKAGILKQGVPACTCASGEPLDLIRRRAAETGAPLDVLGEHFSCEVLDADRSSVTMTYSDTQLAHGAPWSPLPLSVPLAGRHNALNAALAIRACRRLSLTDSRITEKAIRDGISNVLWPGRLETLPWDGPGTLLIDPAHNPAAADVLAGNLLDLYPRRRILCIVGMLNDKDVDGVIAPLTKPVQEFIASRPKGDRALPCTALAAALRRYSTAVEETADLDSALSLARERATEDTVVLVTGSFYTVGEVRELLGEKGCLTSLRE